MNTGAFGENFPYSNFHDLNMDWIIKIAKDFLDQYTNIQNTINTGLQDLEDKKDELEDLLQQWYDTHSEDIADQLADALNQISVTLNASIAEFNDRADAKVASAIASIPEDYTELSTLVQSLFTGYIAAKYSNGVTNSLTPVHISNVTGTPTAQGSPIDLGFQLTNGRTYFVTATANNIEYIFKYGVMVNDAWEHTYDYTSNYGERTAIVSTANSGELYALASTSAIDQNVVIHARIYDITDFSDTSYLDMIYNYEVKEFNEIVSSKTHMNNLEWERGTLADNTGAPASSTQRIRTTETIRVHKGDTFWIDPADGYNISVVTYTDFGEYIAETGWMKTYTATGTENIRILMRRSNNTTVSTDIAKYLNCSYNKFSIKSHVRLISYPLIGDTILIKTEDGKNILIDIGREADYNILQRTLYTENVKAIDYLIITHYHDDHVTVNGLTNLINDFDLTSCTAILPPTIPSTYEGNQYTPGWQVRALQSDIENLLSTNSIAYVKSYAYDITNMYLGETYFKFYNMVQTELFAENVDYNDLSLVCTMFSGNNKVLLTGDMMKTLEEKLISEIDYTVDIAKFGHHGLNNQNNISMPFWHQLKPDLFVSCSPSNMETYGANYANSGQIRFANYNMIKNIMTGISGDIIIECGHEGYCVNGINHLLSGLSSSEFFDYIL